MASALRSTSAALGLAALATPLFAQSTREPDRSSPAQASLAARHAGYAAFRARAGGQWVARFDEEGGNPALIVGSGIRVSETPIATIGEAETHARGTLETYPELWGAKLEE